MLFIPGWRVRKGFTIILNKILKLHMPAEIKSFT